MLAARSPARLARTFATVADTAGLKVASVESPSRTASVTLLVKAGSRFEPKTGTAHVLKNFAFKSTAKRSALGTVREAELYGGVLSASLSREHLALTADFLKGDEAYFVDLLTSFVTSGKYARHELLEYVAPVTMSESEIAANDPAVQAVELAHGLAFRSGLGASLFAPAHNSISHEDVQAFAKSAFAQGNIAVLGSGISQATLSELVSSASLNTLSTSTLSSPSSRYFGGETRLESHSGPQTVFIGFGTTGAPTAELSALAAYLSTTPSVKWTESHSPLPSNVQVVHLPYSDASLFGLLVQGNTGKEVTESAKAAVQALKQVKFGEPEAARALHKAKFNVASAVDTREGLVAYLGSKVLAGADATVESSLASLDTVNAASLNKAAESLFKSKPTFVAVGKSSELPYVDELGL